VARIAAPAVEPALAAPLAVPVAPALAASAAAVNAAALPPRVASSAALPLLAAPLPATALASAPRLPTLAELPETVRRELPVFTLGGSVYAEQASQRMVIINGQVMREGDRLAPELLLQQIRLKSVLLDYRGQRFELLF
jgi:general secretion pathway protein B